MQLKVMQMHPEVDTSEVSALRKDPYRLFFPLGVLLGWIGVGQWLLFSLRLDGNFRVVFHSMVQVQGFLACFVAGFLFTFIPRRTQGAPPATWQLAVAAACPFLLCGFAWAEQWVIAQAFWLVQLGVLLQFVVSRAQAMKQPRSTPASLIWIPLGLIAGLGGALVTGLPGLHDLGRGLVLEGMVAALVMGIGAMLVPVVTRAEPPKPAAEHPLQLLLAAIFLFSFALQTLTSVPVRVAYVLRFGVALAVLVRGAKLWRWPTEPGLNRRVVWFAAWCLPLGYAVLSLFPEQRSAGLHVIFLGSFGMLSMAIGQHVIAAHGNRGDWLKGWPRATWAMAVCMSVALLARVAMQLDGARYLQRMTAAALAFIAAGAAWLWGMAPMLRSSR